jgi:hypothetical protein
MPDSILSNRSRSSRSRSTRSRSTRSKHVHWKPTKHIIEIPLRNCDNEIPEMKKEILRHYENLLKYTCCDAEGCDVLGDQLQQAQYTCNDLFGSARHTQDPSKFVHSPDSKGNLHNNTRCEHLKNRKIEIGEKALKYERKTRNNNNNWRSKQINYERRTQSMGGKRRTHNRRSNKKK